MRKYFFVSLLSIAVSYSHAQVDQWKIDSLKIEDLKKQLKDLKDTNHINCLNDLAWAWFQSSRPLKLKADSAFPYAKKANEEAIRMDYKKGIAKSYVNLAMYHKTLNAVGARSGNRQAEAKDWEKYIRLAIRLGEEIHDDLTLGYAYGDLGALQQRLGPSDDLMSDEVIKNWEKSIFYMKRGGNEEAEEEMTTWACMACSERGDYEKGIGFCQQSLQLNLKEVARKKTKGYRDYLVQQSLINMAKLYEVAGDYEQALTYLRQSRQYGIEKNTGWDMQAELGELFTRFGQFDSALYLLKKFTANNPRNIYGKMWLGETYLGMKDYDTALKLLQESIDSFRTKYTMGAGLMRALLDVGKIYIEKKNYKAAFQNTIEGFQLANKQKAKHKVMEGYKLLSTIYYNLGEKDKAFQYLLKHVELKDSILNHQFLWRLNQYKTSAAYEKKESQIALLNRDNKIKEQQLKQEAQLKRFLTLVVVSLFLIGFFVFRWLSLKRKNENLKNAKTQSELKQQASELEMQALRAQMSPHFIFNCLNSINRFIFKNETREASDYLTRFSRLIRMVLLHSQKKLVPLEDELEMLKLYLDMERLRFKNAFDYHITTTNAIENSSVFIPPLLLQPFCENAIWHGLMHKDGQGHLNIELNEAGGILHCSITDDGVGREKAEEFKSKSAEKEKSMGLKITKERLSLLNQGTTGGTFYEIEDVKNDLGEIAGTRVQLKIRYKESVEEIV